MNNLVAAYIYEGLEQLNQFADLVTFILWPLQWGPMLHVEYLPLCIGEDNAGNCDIFSSKTSLG